MTRHEDKAEPEAVTGVANDKRHGLSDPRIYLALERTFLAWIRTGLALMGFGFIAARFGIFLRDEAAYLSLAPRHPGVSLPLGISLIFLGVVISLVAAVRHRRQVSALDKGVFRSAFGALFATATAGILALFGTVIALYMATI